MGLNQSKAQSKSRGPTSGQPTTERLYPNIASEFPTYGRPNTLDFRGAPTNPYEACFGNTMPNFVHNAGPSYPYNPVPSAPPEILCAVIPATGQTLAKQEDWVQTRQAESLGKQERGNKHEDKRNNDNDSRKPCPNAGIGCKLHFDTEQMKQHLKECLFRDVPCPMNGVFGKCSWIDKVKYITTHFEDNHPENIGQVNQRNTLTSHRTIHLVDLKPHKFLVHIKVDEVEKKTLFAVQAYTNQFSASKWTYEFEFTGPRMEEKLGGTCFTAGVSIEEKFKKLQCRVLRMSICVMDGFKRGGLSYKYRIIRKETVGMMKKLEANRNTKEGANRNTYKEGNRNTTTEGTSRIPSKAVISTSKRVAAT